MKHNLSNVVSYHNVIAENRLEHHSIFFTGLYGSQNYKLDNENSDVDTKSFVIPDFYQLTRNHNAIINSNTTELESGGTNTVIDLRTGFVSFRKAAINFLELLYTEHVVVNPEYKKYYAALKEKRKQIARMCPDRFFQSTCGTIKNTLKQYTNTGSSKKLAMAMFYQELLERFLVYGDSFEDCLISKHLQKLKYIKYLNDDEKLKEKLYK